MITVYVDGSVLRNPNGPGGWAFHYMLDGCAISHSGGEPETTNNRMEMMAAIKALESLLQHKAIEDRVCIVSDSQYVTKGITEWLPTWKRRRWYTASGGPVLNRELWERLEELANKFQTRWSWVRGHNGVEGNELVDKLAREAAYEQAAMLADY